MPSDTSSDEIGDIGDIVELESGKRYPIVGLEQGGRTVRVPCGPMSGEIDFCTREFFRDEGAFEVVKKEATVWDIYRLGMMRGPNNSAVRKALDAVESGKSQHAQHILRTVLDEDTDHEWMKGHILDDNGRCAAENCDLSIPQLRDSLSDDTRLTEGLKEAITNRVECPSTLETINEVVSDYVK